MMQGYWRGGRWSNLVRMGLRKPLRARATHQGDGEDAGFPWGACLSAGAPSKHPPRPGDTA